MVDIVKTKTDTMIDAAKTNDTMLDTVKTNDTEVDIVKNKRYNG